MNFAEESKQETVVSRRPRGVIMLAVLSLITVILLVMSNVVRATGNFRVNIAEQDAAKIEQRLDTANSELSRQSSDLNAATPVAQDVRIKADTSLIQDFVTKSQQFNSVDSLASLKSDLAKTGSLASDGSFLAALLPAYADADFKSGLHTQVSCDTLSVMDIKTLNNTWVYLYAMPVMLEKTMNNKTETQQCLVMFKSDGTKIYDVSAKSMGA